MLEKKKPISNSFIGSEFLVNIFFICTSFLHFQHTVTASCAFPNGEVGECIKFEECRSAVILSRKGLNPGICSLEEGTVCCTDYIRKMQGQRRSLSDIQLSRPQKWSSQPLDVEGSIIKYNSDLNIQKKKNIVEINNNGNIHGKKKTSDIVEEPYKFEAGNIFYSNSDFTSTGKKKWKDDRTTENDYHYEHVTKNTSHGPSQKELNKHTGDNSESNNLHKWEEANTTRRLEWASHGGRITTGFWFNGQNEYERDYSNQRTTPKSNAWSQETYSAIGRPGYLESGSQSNNAANGNEYFNTGSTRRPQSPSSEHWNGNHPNMQNSPNQWEKDLTSQQGFNSQNNRPNYQQESFPSYRPNSRPGFQKRRISEQKCEEYSKQVTENITGLPLTTNPDPVTIHVRKCITPQQLIVGGENTTIGEFPHMAAIGFRDRNKKQIAWNCGGTLISEQFVMTAAHCTSTTFGRPVKVRLGEYNLMKNDDGAYPVDYGVLEIITHPEYMPPSKYNDIALLKLSRKVTFFKHIRPACLYSQETFSASKAIATGWGRMYYEGGPSEILQKVVLTIVDNYTCNRLYKVNVKTEVLSRGIVDSQICAGELSGGKDTCQGDSGGPLSITSTKCIHHIIGITSFGKSCALPNSTGVYTRVSAYVPWIESLVWPTDYKYNL